MFEFDQYERRLRDRPAAHVDVPYRPVAGVMAMSFLWWSEHCIECAEPACFASCSLYQRRPDGRCRRFAFGLCRNRAFPSLRGYGAEVAFKTWGKLETHGNAFMEPAEVVLERERRLAFGAPVWRVLSWMGAATTRDPNGRRLPPVPRRIVKRLNARRPSPLDPEAFLVEVYNPNPTAVRLQVSMRATSDARGGLPPRDPSPFLTTLTLEPGYNCHRVAATRFEPVLESGLPFKITVMPDADSTVHLVFLSLDLVTETTGAAAARQPVKCVVFDLDGTLWNGVLVEDGDTRPNTGMVRLVRELDARGILLSIASKNDHARAWSRLHECGLADYFLHPQIGWGRKSAGIRAIAGDLGIGLDAVAFVDDSPFERDEVARALPMVECFDAKAVGGILQQPRFRGSNTADSANRRQYYKDDLNRTADRSRWRDDYLGFLRSCELVLTVSRYTEEDFARVLELVQRTNQLNFSGTKYTRAEIEELVNDEDIEAYVLRCGDRYGSYGTVGAALVRRTRNEVRVEDMMISCRVQGRSVETAFLAFLSRQPASATTKRLWVRHRSTGRNGPARSALEEAGFEADPDGTGLSFDLTAHAVPCEVVRIESGVGRSPAARGRV